MRRGRRISGSGGGGSGGEGERGGSPGEAARRLRERGVAANSYLRRKLAERAEGEGWSLHFPARKYCTDNAAMIACAGGFRLKLRGSENFMDYADMDADPSWELGDASDE